MTERDFKPNDSAVWNSKHSAGMDALAWGLVESVAEDGTITVRAGAYRNRVTRLPDEIVRHEAGPTKFQRVYPNTARRRVTGG